MSFEGEKAAARAVDNLTAGSMLDEENEDRAYFQYVKSLSIAVAFNLTFNSLLVNSGRMNAQNAKSSRKYSAPPIFSSR